MKMRTETSVLILCGSLVVMLILVWHLEASAGVQDELFDNIKVRDCTAGDGIQRDQCLAFLAQKMLNDSICQSIVDPLVRSICHRDLIYANELDLESRASKDVYFPFPINEEDCRLVENPALRLECELLFSRPRVLGNLEGRGPPRYTLHDGPCEEYDDHHYPICISVRAAASPDVEGGIGECRALGDEGQGECMFIVVATAIDLLEPDGLYLLGDACSRVHAVPWRGACFSLLAERLAQGGLSAEEVAPFLRNLSGIGYFNLFEPVLRKLSPLEQQNLCGAMRGKQWSACSWALAWINADPRNPDGCASLRAEFRQDCASGAAWKAGMELQEPFERNIARCDAFAEPLRDRCFGRLAFEVSRKYLFGGWNLSFSKGICETFPN